MKILRYSIYLLFLLQLLSCREKQTSPFEAIELISTGSENNTILLKELSKLGVATSDEYKWNNHFLVYAPKDIVDKIAQWARGRFPTKTYETPFYNFNREKMTGEKPTTPWKHVILSANLVSDIALQNEYIEYHRTQFDEWPELSEGFAKADFQQVLLFRNGCRLLLVITIPKDKTFEELNPKTTENNPRVAEWNALMTKYQEGLSDAPKGSTWITFEPLQK